MTTTPPSPIQLVPVAQYEFPREHAESSSAWPSNLRTAREVPDKTGLGTYSGKRTKSTVYRHKLRTRVRQVTSSNVFGTILFVLVAINMLVIVLDPTSTHPNVILAAEIVCCSALSLELLGKGYGWGIGAVLKDNWSRLDLLIVASGIIGLFDESANIVPLRAFRGLRLLRTITYFRSLRRIFVTLVKILGRITPVLVLLSMAIFLYSILGLQVFRGRLQYACIVAGQLSNVSTEAIEMVPTQHCNMHEPSADAGNNSNSSLDHSCPHGFVCSVVGNEGNGYQGFDNVFMSMLTVFQSASLEGWTPVMYATMNAVSPWSVVYFVTLVFILSFVLINLCVAVVCDAYADVANSDGISFAAKPTGGATQHNEWTGGSGKCTAKWRRRLESAFSSVYYEIGSVAVTLANIVIISLDSADSSPEMQQVVSLADDVFVGVYSLEIVMKLCTYRNIRAYFADPLNVMDCIVLLMSIPSVFGDSVSFTFCRVFRVIRLLRLLSTSPSMQKLLRAVLRSWTISTTLFGFIAVIVLAFAVLGMTLFRDSATDQSSRLGFETFPASLVTLFVVLTGESWSDVMYDMISTAQGWASPPFFLLYFSTVHYVLLNVVIAVLLYQFQASEEQKLQVQLDTYRSGHRADEKGLHTDDGDSFERTPGMAEVSPPNGVDVKTIAVADGMFVSRYTRTRHMLGRANTCALGNVSSGFDSNQSKRSDLKVAFGHPERHPERMELMGSQLGRVLAMDRGRSGAVRTTPRKAKDRAGRSKALPGKRQKLLKSKSAPGLLSSIQRSNGKEKPPLTLSTDDKMYDHGDPSGSAVVGADVEQDIPTGNMNSVIHEHAETPVKKGDCAMCDEYDQTRATVRFATEEDQTKTGRDLQPVHVSKERDLVVSILVVLSSIFLAANNPHENHRSPWKEIIDYGEWLLAGLLILEMLLAIYTVGPRRYWRSRWNRIDLVILCVSTIAQVASWCVDHRAHVIRLLGAFQPVRVVRRNAGLRKVLYSLKEALPSLLNVAVLCLIFFTFFALLLVSIFKGRMGSCNDRTIAHKYDCIGMFFSASGVYLPRVWSAPWLSFDDAATGLLSVFVTSTLEGYTDLMFSVMDSTGPVTGPQTNASWWAFGVFLFLIVVCSFFFTQLFVSVLIDTMSVHSGQAALTDAQRSWKDQWAFISAERPLHICQIPDSGIRRMLSQLRTNPYYEWFTLCVTLLSVFFPAIEHDDQSRTVGYVVQACDYIAVLLLVIDVLIRFLVMGPKVFTGDVYGMLDALVVMVCVLSTPFGIDWIRMFRLLVVLCAFNKVEYFSRLIRAFTSALPSCVHALGIMCVAFYVFGVVGMYLFGNVRTGGQLGVNANFSTFPRTLLTLLRIATGEDWPKLMQDCAVSPPLCAAPNCGHPIFSIVFYVTFQLVCAYVFISLFVAIIVESFGLSSSSGRACLPGSDGEALERYKYVFLAYAYRRDNMIHVSDLNDVLTALGPPLGAKKTTHRHELRLHDLVRAKLRTESTRGSIDEFVSFSTLLSVLVSLFLDGHKLEYHSLLKEMRFKKEARATVAARHIAARYKGNVQRRALARMGPDAEAYVVKFRCAMTLNLLQGCLVLAASKLSTYREVIIIENGKLRKEHISVQASTTLTLPFLSYQSRRSSSLARNESYTGATWGKLRNMVARLASGIQKIFRRQTENTLKPQEGSRASFLLRKKPDVQNYFQSREALVEELKSRATPTDLQHFPRSHGHVLRAADSLFEDLCHARNVN